MSKLKICILGASGFIGRTLFNTLKVDPSLDVKGVSRSDLHGYEVWDYKMPMPEFCANADMIINCARAQNFESNITLNQQLLERLQPNQTYVYLSSNAIYAKPTGIAQYFFKGDAYIREKKTIEALLLGSSKRVHIIQPSNVLGEGGAWQQLLSLANAQLQIELPQQAQCSQVKTIKVNELATQIHDNLNDLTVISGKEIYSKSITLDDLFNQTQILYTLPNHQYFSSRIKNLVLHVFNSHLMPDFIIYRLQKPKSASDKLSKEPKFTGIQAMTRLFLTGNHTL